MPKSYSETLNLPQTDFAMKSNLIVREPQFLDYWYSLGLYERMQQRNQGKPRFFLHDGPPFSNGNIHMGTALNKIIKDIIVKSKSMTGYCAPYIPGWDNHGMPIESAIIKKSKLDRKKMPIPDFRSACEAFAMDYVNIQMAQFKRLGVMGDWENPYLTMSKDFEAREVKVFGEMYKKGYIYKGLKPVYWCPIDETALAEAEIEYATQKCTSIYVRFALAEDNGVLDGVCDFANTYVIIWTTTPWTLPGNLAVALNPQEVYAVVKTDGGCYIVAETLATDVMAAGGIQKFEILKTFRGSELEYAKVQHPFMGRTSLVINADYVTTDSGTGCVHIAPGFGKEDHIACQKYKIKTVVPVDNKGYQTEEAGKFAGLHYAQSNDAIIADLAESGSLFASYETEHEYPHCWRCKNPVIFRATPQWFCSVESFKDQAIKACDTVSWTPAWGGDNMKSMIEGRADWCISRQRYWGLPITVFYCQSCQKPVCDDQTTDAVSKLFAKEGSNAWYSRAAAEILPEGFKCPHCGGTDFDKELDILDCWFDSGSSHFGVPNSIKSDAEPCEMYMEGGDQYRGWFQSSMLTSVGVNGIAPYKSVISHGWVVDGQGRAMHKSLGNSVAPEELIKKYGADLIRLWVASGDYHTDVRVSDNIFVQLSEAYRKIRNTMRMLLANLKDFCPDQNSVATADLLDLDKWVLAKYNRLVKTALDGYASYDFHDVYRATVNFCTNELSKLYIDIIKDRLYTEKADSRERRSAQTAIFQMVSGLARLLAPILSFTAEDVWKFVPKAEGATVESVFLNDLPKHQVGLFADVESAWDVLFDVRDIALKALDDARIEKVIGKSLDAELVLKVGNKELFDKLKPLSAELATVFIVSRAELIFDADTEGVTAVVARARGQKCERCWTYSQNGEIMDEDFICSRCAAVLKN